MRYRFIALGDQGVPVEGYDGLTVGAIDQAIIIRAAAELDHFDAQVIHNRASKAWPGREVIVIDNSVALCKLEAIE